MPSLLDIVGQDAAVAQLQRLYAGNRRPHAFIFAGPEGVGRRSTAVEFGKLLLCRAPVRRANARRFAALPPEAPLAEACETCDSCRAVGAGTSFDLQLVYKELARFHDEAAVRDRVMQELGIEVIRQFLLDPAYRAAAGGRGKVFIVRQADLMSVPAQNALLKTLEEPPPGVSIILIAPSPADLLPTTRSRCQLVHFGPLPAAFVTERLVKEEVAPPEAAFWAQLTEGSIGRSLRLAEEGLYEIKRQLVDRLAAGQGSPDPALAELLTKTMDKQAKRLANSAGFAMSLANRLAGEALLQVLTSAHRDALSVRSRADRPLIHADQAAAISKIAGRFAPEDLAEILTQLSRYEQLLWQNVNTKLLWDNVAITCASAAAMEL